MPLGGGAYAAQLRSLWFARCERRTGTLSPATAHNFAGMTVEKGAYKDEQGWGAWTLQNGDKVFFTYTFTGQVKPGGVGEAKGMVTFTGGTGKCAGIKGSFPSTRYTVRTSVEGLGLSYSQETIKYTLP